MNKARFHYILIGFCVIFFSCGGSLTPEQREKARKAIEEGQIKRITPIELTEAAMVIGKKIAAQVRNTDPFLNDNNFIDSLSKSNQVVIYALKPGMTGLSSIESSIADAYQVEGDIAGAADNVQKLEGDSLLYTSPVGNERPDGSRPFSHAIAIKMAVKSVVLSIKN